MVPIKLIETVEEFGKWAADTNCTLSAWCADGEWTVEMVGDVYVMSSSATLFGALVGVIVDYLQIKRVRGDA